MVHKSSIVVLDFGGQYAHLIASRVRRFGYYSEILPADTKASELKGVAGIILSGGPQSVYEKGSPQADRKIFDLGVPILGLCYGHQWIAHVLGGEVKPGAVKEYGRMKIEVLKESAIFKSIPHESVVWMSHGDTVSKLPSREFGNFVQIARTPTCAFAGFSDEARKIFGLQFHIEVAHTEYGMQILRNFVELCKPASWSIKSYAQHIGDQILREVGDRKVFMLVSGGVDSTVAFTLLNKVLGKDRVQGLLVDTGLMRKNEVKEVIAAFQKLKIDNLKVVDASEEFFRNLEGVYDPEEKRRIIGNTFITVQQRIFKEMGLEPKAHSTSSGQANGQKPMAKSWLLGQGTIYPDTIETGGTKHADRIKTHHNRVQVIQEMIEKGLVVEPLKELYKDEVRELGEELGLPHELVWRHPFPGPGLGVRILCAKEPDEDLGLRTEDIGIPYCVLPVRSVGVQGDGRTYRHALALFHAEPCSVTERDGELATSVPNSIPAFNRVLLCTSQEVPADFTFTPSSIMKERADLLREADAIVDEEMREADLYEKIWQFPVVLLPCGFVEGGQSVVLRPIESLDAMTANTVQLPAEVLKRMTKRILKLKGIDAVFLDLTNKPPATIEWE
ncbi:MAG: glutamine-hydrolyzing GMP synthase [Candidatus Peribacteraceae bacterium]